MRSEKDGIGLLAKLEYRIAFYDKATAKTEVYLLSSNPLFPVSFGFGDYYGINGNVLIAARSADSILGTLNNPYLSKERIEALKQHFKEQFKKPLHEDDNPILCIYEFAFQ